MDQRDFTLKAHRRFVRDIQRAMDAGAVEAEFYDGIYFGRWYFAGPAVKTEQWPEDIMEHTRVRCDSDNFGNGWIVYPADGDDALRQRRRL